MSWSIGIGSRTFLICDCFLDFGVPGLLAWAAPFSIQRTARTSDSVLADWVALKIWISSRPTHHSASTQSYAISLVLSSSSWAFKPSFIDSSSSRRRNNGTQPRESERGHLDPTRLLYDDHHRSSPIPPMEVWSPWQIHWTRNMCRNTPPFRPTTMISV